MIFPPSRHGGDVHFITRSREKTGDLYDFSANSNPLGPPSWLRRTISHSLSDLVHYPDPYCFALTQAIAKEKSLPQSSIIAANGTSELLYLLPQVLDIRRAVIPVPSYIDYARAMMIHGVEVVPFFLAESDGFMLNLAALQECLQPGDAVVIATPNNPTATMVDAQSLVQIARECQKVTFIVDEAFLQFVPGGVSVAGREANIISLHSMTKFFAIPGLRLGYGVFPEKVAEKVREIMVPWSVNTLAQRVGEKCIEDTDYHLETVSYVRKCNAIFYEKLQQFENIKIYPSRTNFFLVKITNASTYNTVYEKLLERNIVIRRCDNYHQLDRSYFRIAVKNEEENDYFIEQLHAAVPDLAGSRKRKLKKRKITPALMVQGTASNAGKSVLVAGFCRILMQDGYDVAPFKAQNMSLNSFVTHDGLEMGRAQVVQAQAARLPPDVRMNPVLLKPNSDVGSQIIVQGKVVGNMIVSQYVKYKQEAGRIACKCYDSLAAEHDVILLEGAGSPGEVNLKQHDIVNMAMARYAHAPVLLVGDIDRGGVYASFVGTMEVLDEWERKLIRGFLVNRFRGDSRLLTDAHFYVKEHTGVDVIGTIPYLKNLGIPEEDSVSFKSGYLQQEKSASQIIEIILISLPHISNLNDIEPFFAEPDVYLKIVDNAGDIGEPDAIILPGSKNVFADRAFLVESGIASVIVKNAQRGCEIVGICGGYQLLGKRISDPASIESDNQTIPCLDLLEIETTLAKEKTRVKKSGIHTESNLAVEGYEIHHGLSDTPLIPVFTFADGSSCGSSHPHKNVWGAYLHGLFDADLFRRYWIDSLRTRKGYSALGKVVAPYDLEAAFDRLADAIRESVDMKAIYRIIEKHDT